jgi:hypothetical protein
MVALWKTQGCRVEPWRADVSYGAVMNGDELMLSVQSRWPWKGKVVFDRARHRENFNLPADYPRLNQFQEWFTVQRDSRYKLTVADSDKTFDERTVDGSALLEGLQIVTRGTEVRPTGEKPVRLRVRTAN